MSAGQQKTPASAAPGATATGEELLGQAWGLYAAEAFGDARRLARQALSILRAAGGRPSAAMVRALLLTGQIEQDAGRHGAAERSFQEANTVSRKLADDAPVRVQAQLALANLWRVRGRYPEAEALLLATLHLAETTVGPKAMEVADICNALGITGKYTGRFDQAEAWYRRALGITAQVLSPDHPDIATIYHNLGGLHHARGAFERAEAPARRAVEIRQRACGPQHLAVAADKAALASILDALGRPGEAEVLLRDALAVFERAFGVGHYEVAVNLHNLAAITHRRGDLAQAETLYRRVLAIKEDVLGHDHPELATTLNNLGLVRQERGDRAEALELFTRAVMIIEDLVEPDHPVLSAARNHRAALRGTVLAARHRGIRNLVMDDGCCGRPFRCLARPRRGPGVSNNHHSVTARPGARAWRYPFRCPLGLAVGSAPSVRCMRLSWPGGVPWASQ